MAAPASAPPLAVNQHIEETIEDEKSVKVTLHFVGGPDKRDIVWFRRGRFRKPSLVDIMKWLQASEGYNPKYAPYYKDKEGDTISMGTEEDWDECVYAWRNSDVIRIAMRVESKSE